MSELSHGSLNWDVWGQPRCSESRLYPLSPAWKLFALFSIHHCSLSTFALDYCEWILLPHPIGVGLLHMKRVGQWNVGRSDSSHLRAQVCRSNTCFCSAFPHICNSLEKTMPWVIPNARQMRETWDYGHPESKALSTDLPPRDEEIINYDCVTSLMCWSVYCMELLQLISIFETLPKLRIAL